MNTPQPSETPRTDALREKSPSNTIYCRHVLIEHEKLEKELNAANLQIMRDTECIERIQKRGYELEAELEQLKRANGEIGILVNDIKSLCQYRFNQDQLALAGLCIEDCNQIESLLTASTPIHSNSHNPNRRGGEDV